MKPANQSQHELEQIEHWLQTCIMHPLGVKDAIASADARELIDVGPQEAEQVVTRSKALTAIQRLSIYSYAYSARLAECLREQFPVLRHALGDDTFDAFAIDYLRRYPSRSYTLTQLGSHFPRYLAETRPEQDDGATLPVDWPDFLIDLATLELAFSEVFDGPGVEGERLLDAEQLSQTLPERLWEARLVGVDCLRLLSLRYPVHHYFSAVQRDGDPLPPAPAETWLAVTRRQYVVCHYELSRRAYELLRSLLAGETVGDAVGRAAEAAGSDIEQLANDLGTWFHRWAAEDFFRAVEFR